MFQKPSKDYDVNSFDLVLSTFYIPMINFRILNEFFMP